MNKRLALLLVVVCALFVSPAKPQSTGTNLVMGAHWDNNAYIQGTVTISKLNGTAPETVIVTKTLSQGWSNVTEPLAANSVYNVTLTTPDGKQLVKFPIVTVLVNPDNIVRAEIDIICRSADRSLASARMDVVMNF